MDIYHTVYQTTNLVNGKTYIGAHSTNDPWDSYLGSGKLMRKAITKYGRDAFTKKVLAVFDNPDDMWATEKRIVGNAVVADGSFYNLIPGGRLNTGFGKATSESTKLKMRLAKLGRPKSAEHKLKMRLAKLGKPAPRRTRKQIEESLTHDYPPAREYGYPESTSAEAG